MQWHTSGVELEIRELTHGEMDAFLYVFPHSSIHGLSHYSMASDHVYKVTFRDDLREDELYLSKARVFMLAFLCGRNWEFHASSGFEIFSKSLAQVGVKVEQQTLLNSFHYIFGSYLMSGLYEKEVERPFPMDLYPIGAKVIVSQLKGEDSNRRDLVDLEGAISTFEAIELLYTQCYQVAGNIYAPYDFLGLVDGKATLEGIENILKTYHRLLAEIRAVWSPFNESLRKAQKRNKYGLSYKIGLLR